MFKKIKNTNEIGFEERERKTPILGYILLIAMSIVVLMFGFATLDDLSKIPQKPEKLSYCSADYFSYGWEYSFREYNQPYYERYYDRSYRPPLRKKECVFAEIEKKYGIEELFLETSSDRKELRELKDKIEKNEFDIQRLKQDYQTELLEKIANSPNTAENKSVSIKIQELESQTSILKISSSKLEKKLKPSEDILQEKYDSLKKEYKSSWTKYDLYVFLWQLVLVFPLFFILLRYYFKLSAKNSPYLIILAFLLIPASIFVIQILFVYFWGLFIATTLEFIWNIVKNIQILKSLLSYLGMLISALIFGGAVYFLQKKIFNKKRIALRHLRDRKCPNCSFSLELSKNFCSNCAHKILEKCTECGKDSYADLEVCQYCRYRKLQKDVN